jgi:hypothetical protein
MTGDNFHIDITHDGDIADAMRIAFAGAPGGKAEAYIVDDNKGLVFFWSKDENKSINLPFKLDASGAADFAKRWLAEQDYGPQLDHDGDNCKGWRLYNESWGRVEGYTYGFVAVQPAWAMYGK